MVATKSTPRRRPAFTLLEVLLASGIAVLLMAALYTAVDVQLRHARAGREVTEQARLARSLLDRIGNDIVPSLGPVIPNNTSSSAGSQAAAGGSTAGGSSASGAASTTGSTTPTTGSNTTGTSSSGTGSTSGGSSSGSSAGQTIGGLNGPVQFNYGVQGTADTLTLFISRIPRDADLSNGGGVTDAPTGISDLRRITYWLASTGDKGGLARQEIKAVTSEDAQNNMPPNIPDEGSFVLAEEVRSVAFRYWDGSSWQDTWDGTEVGADGMTPIGPPMAIEITLGIAPPGSDNDRNVKTYRHVVALPTANSPTPQTTTGSTGSGSTSP